jgi:hypothetical protein
MSPPCIIKPGMMRWKGECSNDMPDKRKEGGDGWKEGRKEVK